MAFKAETVKILSRTLSYHIYNFCEAKKFKTLEFL